MNKKITLFLLLALLVLPVMVLAIDVPAGVPEGSNIDLVDLAKRIQAFVWPVFLIFTILVFIFIGALFLIANGEPAKLVIAKKALLWGIIGFIIALLAFSFVAIIVGLIAPESSETSPGNSTDSSENADSPTSTDQLGCGACTSDETCSDNVCVPIGN